MELERADAGVDVCVLLPGAINKPHFDRVRQKLGVQPQPVPPIYQPEPFAEVVLHCCEDPPRELPIGWGAQARARTAWTTLRLHPTLATALALIGLGLPAQAAHAHRLD